MYPSMLRTSGDWFADFEQLQDRLDELFGGRAATSSIRAVGRAGAFPALNVGTSSDALEIYALAPGVDPKSVEVSVEKGVLAIAGERPAPPTGRARSATSTPTSASAAAFAASSRCPRTPTRRRVEANYRNGVLKIVVPKHEASKPRQIQVTSAG